MKFNIGDIVECIPGSHNYVYTTVGVPCEVIGISGNYITVVVNTEYRPMEYEVKSKNFRHVSDNSRKLEGGDWI